MDVEELSSLVRTLGESDNAGESSTEEALELEESESHKSGGSLNFNELQITGLAY